MPGPQPRRTALQNLSSTIARRASYGPGAYRVVRSSSPVEEVAGWITPPPIVVTGFPVNWIKDSVPDESTFDEADVPAAMTEAYYGTGQVLDAQYIGFSVTLLSVGGIFPPSDNTIFNVHVTLGFVAVSLSDVMTAYVGEYTLPPGAEQHPDDTWTLVGDVHLLGQMRYGGDGPTDISLRQVDPDVYVLSGEPLWVTPPDIAAATVVASGSADGDPLDGGSDLAFDVPVEFGGTSNVAVYVASIDNYNPTGATWDYRKLQELNLYDVELPEGGGPSSPHWEATLQPPRYRITSSPSEWIPDLSGNFYWDAGLYLPSDFASLAGYPATLPPGASELDFYILGPGVDFNDTWPDWYLAYVYSGGNGVDSSGITTPVAGSHLWVYYDVGGGTPSDPTDPPATYVPATLAANGTA